MSECVVRMEMPKHCGECELKTWDIWPGSFKCVKTMHDIMSHIRNRTKPNDCPILCQLPDGHGRLVDADAYSAEMKDRQDAAWKWRNEAIAEEDEVKLARAEGAFTAFVEAKLTWDEQVTIVPADTAERSET